jgi:hypothetical protein
MKTARLLTFIFLTCTFKAFAVALTTTTPATISSVGNNTIPQVAVNASGNGLAVWQKTTRTQIEAAFFNNGTSSWTSPLIIGQGGSPQIGIDSNSNGIAVWVNQNQIQAARFHFSTKTWSSPIFLTSSGFNTLPKLSVGSTGNALAVWVNASAGVAAQVQSAVFDSSSSAWSAVVNVSTQPGATPVVGTDQNGNGLIVWQDLNTGSILFSRAVKR